MRKSFINNLIFNFLYEIVALLVLIVTTPYISRVLGVTAVGDYGFTSGIVSYFGLFAVLGTTNYATREIAFNQENKDERSRIFWEIFLLRVICITFVFVIYCIFLVQFAQEYLLLYGIQSLMFLVWLADITWFFRGIENFKIVSIQSSLVKILGMLLVFLFVKSPSDLWKYTLILMLCFLLGNTITWCELCKYVKRIPFKSLTIFRHLRGSLLFFSSVAAIQVYTVLDQTMLGIIANTTEVGYYTQAQKIIKLALTIITVFVTILLPRISVLFSNRDDKGLDKYWKLSIDYLFLLTIPMMVGCFFVAEDFVPLFFGNGYEPVTKLMKVLCILFPVLGMGQLTGSILSSICRQRKNTIAVSVGALINLVINFILIPIFASIGAVIASIVAEAVVTCMQLYFLSDCFNVKYIEKSLLKYLLPIVLMLLSLVLIGCMPFTGFTMLLVKIVVGVVVYIGGLLAIKDKIVYSIFSKLIRKM